MDGMGIVLIKWREQAGDRSEAGEGNEGNEGNEVVCLFLRVVG